MSETKENTVSVNEEKIEEPVKGKGKGRGKKETTKKPAASSKRGKGKKSASEENDNVAEPKVEEVKPAESDEHPEPEKDDSDKKEDKKTSKHKAKKDKKSDEKPDEQDSKPEPEKTEEKKPDEKVEEKPEEKDDKMKEDEPKTECKNDEVMTDAKDDHSSSSSSDVKVDEPKKEIKTVTSSKAKKSPRRKDDKKGEEEKLESPKKKARTTPKRKSKPKKKDDKMEDDDEDEEDEEEMNEAESDDDDQGNDEDDDDMFEPEDDPEDEDVEGKGYGHVLMFTRMPNDIRSKLVVGVKEIPDGYMTRNIKLATHVVCDEPVRTIKLMAAILRGVWVVSSKWVTDSIEAKKWLPEAEYEIKEFAGVKASREAHAKVGATEQVSGLFSGMKFVIGHTDHTNPTKTEMKELVLAGDGQVLLMKEIEKTQYYLSCPARPVLPPNLPESAQVITQSAFFNAISNYTTPVSTPVPPKEKTVEEAKPSETTTSDEAPASDPSDQDKEDI